MADGSTQDSILVAECLAGSQEGWNEFYRRFAGLVASVVKRRLRSCPEAVPDTTQDCFVALMAGLGSYDPGYPLPRFICTVVERVCIDEFRAERAQKRHAETEPVDHHDAGPHAGATLLCTLDPPDEHVSRAELIYCLRVSFRTLTERCRELLRLRYYEELSYREIAGIVGGVENTLTVQTRRCLEELRARYLEIQRTGAFL